MSANVSKRYSNGKIYQITDVGYNKCYIGSTCLKLRRRFLQHIGGYYKYLKGEAEYTTSYSMFEEFGVENCKVELVENYPCNSKDELLKQEGFHIRSFDCVNKCISGRTQREYYQEHQQHLAKWSKEYRQQRKEHYKELYATHYQKNKEVILQRKNTKYDCDCGGHYTYSSKAKHFKTEKHQNYLKQKLENE